MSNPLDGIAQKRAAKLLGVIFTGKLSVMLLSCWLFALSVSIC